MATNATLSLRKIGESTLEVLLPNTGEYGYPKASFGDKIHCFTSLEDMDPVISMDPVDNRMGFYLDMDAVVADADYKALCQDLASPVLIERLLTMWAEYEIREDREVTIDVDQAVANAIADKIDALPPAASTRS